MRRPDPLPLPAEECLFHHGIALFNAQQYFETHEAWEEIWRPLPPCQKRAFYHGLIQAAVALEHLRRGNAAGARRLLHTFPRYFDGLPPVFMGLEIARFLADVRAALADVATHPPLGPVALDPARIPIITLQSDPFATGEAARLAPPRIRAWH